MSLTLTPTQVADVLREILATRRGYSPLNDALSDVGCAAARKDEMRLQGRSRTMLRALLALMAFPWDGTPYRVKDAAETVGLTPLEVLRDAVLWQELGVLMHVPELRAYKRVQFLVA
jgi:hypothetical protein